MYGKTTGDERQGAPRLWIRELVRFAAHRKHLSEEQEKEFSAVVERKLAEEPYRGLAVQGGARPSALATLVAGLYEAYPHAQQDDDTESSAVMPMGRRAHRRPVDVTFREGVSKQDALVLKMWFQAGMTASQIGRVFGVSASAVYSIVSRQTSALRREPGHAGSSRLRPSDGPVR